MYEEWAVTQIFCKNGLWSDSPTSSFNSSRCPTRSISGWIVTTAPQTSCPELYTPQADTQLMRSAKKVELLASLHGESVKADK